MRIEWLAKCLGSKWGLRAAALAAAVTVWYAVELATGNNATVSGVPLTVVAPPGWTVTDTGASQVTVHFRGTRDETRLLDRETVRATLEVPGAGAEEGAVLSLGARQISAPGGARVVRVVPS
ncbi:MAG: hypothetical protein IK066_03875 [Kiritimatiellae bacterium]|nr:hypothetical protein [Kiritimatiellia bacterium]